MPRVTTGQFSGCWLNHAGGPNWTIKVPQSRLFERKDSIVRPMERFLSLKSISIKERPPVQKLWVINASVKLFLPGRAVKLSQANLFRPQKMNLEVLSTQIFEIKNFLYENDLVFRLYNSSLNKKDRSGQVIKDLYRLQ